MAQSALLFTAKPHTNQYLSFRSHHPTVHEVAVVRTLMTRANHLSSSGVEWAEEEKQVTEALRSSGYPSGFIHKHTASGRGREEVEDQKPKSTLTLPYICGLSEAIRRVLSHLEVKVVFCPVRTLRQLLVHAKDPVPAEERKGVVYLIPCMDCPKVYIGQTGRCLSSR